MFRLLVFILPSVKRSSHLTGWERRKRPDANQVFFPLNLMDLTICVCVRGREGISLYLCVFLSVAVREWVCERAQRERMRTSFFFPFSLQTDLSISHLKAQAERFWIGERLGRWDGRDENKRRREEGGRGRKDRKKKTKHGQVPPSLVQPLPLSPRPRCCRSSSKPCRCWWHGVGNDDWWRFGPMRVISCAEDSRAAADRTASPSPLSRPLSSSLSLLPPPRHPQPFPLPHPPPSLKVDLSPRSWGGR